MSQIEELRQILSGSNTEALSELRERIENIDQRTRDVAEVLAPAIDEGMAKNDQLIESLTKPVSMGLKKAIRTEPAAYAEILYPVMAPSIRKAIAQAVSSLMVTINQTMSSATTAEGLGLRIRSWRTGMPYAQLALRESLVYRVVHLYLIERETGMMIAETRAEDATSLDSDAVSAMFAAIQSFVQDSFSQNDEDRLTDLKVCEHKVWVAHSRKLMLACVIDGEPRESLKIELYDTLDDIRGEFATAIEEFNSDTAAFVGVEERLQPLMQSELKQDHSKQESQASIGSIIVLGLVALALSYWLYTSIVDSAKKSTLEHYLKQTPGVVVTETYWQDDRLVIEGLQDPDAEIPYNILNAHNMPKDSLEFRTIPFRSLETDMEMLRFRNDLQPPAPLVFEVNDGKIWLIGNAPINWLLDNDVRLRQLGADKRLQLGQLKASKASVEIYLATRSVSEDPLLQAKMMDMLTDSPWTDVVLPSRAQPF